mgnify:CR=1 FL=1
MAQASEADFSRSDPPIDIFEQVVRAQGWRFERVEDDEMAAEVRGNWCDYSLHFAWAPELSAIHVTCAFDVRVPERKLGRVYELLALINDRMWLGHFCLWTAESQPMYFYPAFQHLVWGGKGASDAIAAAMIETVGEA